MHNGYQCLSISDEPYSYLYGIEYLRNIDNPQYIQGFFSSEFNPDVIILGSSKNLHKRSDNAFFVTIRFLYKGIIINHYKNRANLH